MRIYSPLNDSQGRLQKRALANEADTHFDLYVRLKKDGFSVKPQMQFKPATAGSGCIDLVSFQGSICFRHHRSKVTITKAQG